MSGLITDFDITELGPTLGHDSIDIAGTSRQAVISGLTPNTTYTFRIAAHGPGGDSEAIFTVKTDADTTTPTSPTFRSAATQTADNLTTVTVTKPAGTVATDLLVAIYSNDTGLQTLLTAPTGWTEDTRLTIGSGDTVGHVRVFVKLAGASEPASYGFGAAGDSSTTITILCFQNATGIDVAARGASLGTSTSIVAPSVTPTVDNTILVTCHVAVPTPNPAVGRTFTPPSGMTERSDIGSPAGFHYHETSTVAGPAKNVASGTKTATASGALTSSDAITFAVGAVGGNSAVTSITAPAIAGTDATHAAFTGTIVGPGTSYKIQIVGYKLDPFVQTSTTLNVTLDRQPFAADVFVRVWASIGGVYQAKPFETGILTIPAKTGGLAARTPVAAHLTVVAGTTYSNKKYTNEAASAVAGPATIDGAVSGAANNFATCAQFYNIEANGGPFGRLGIYMPGYAYSEDMDITSWGNAYNVGTSNPENQHADYEREGLERRTTIFPPAFNTGGTYGVHDRAASLANGRNMTHYRFDYTDLSGRPGMIGGMTIEDVVWYNYHKFGGGEFIIGGLAGGSHIKGLFWNCVWEAGIRVEGSWSEGLVFRNCTAKSLVNHFAGGVLDISGLTLTG